MKEIDLRSSFRSFLPLAFCLLFLRAPDGAAAPVLRIGGTGAALGTMRLLAQSFEKENPGVRVRVLASLGSTGGIRALGDGTVDIALSARPLQDQERASGVQEIEYGRTPFVFAVPEGLPVEALSLQEIYEIFRGTRVTWPDGTFIRLVLRPPADSDMEFLELMSDEMGRAIEAAVSREGMLFAVTDQECGDYLEKLPGALGTMTLAQIRSEGRKLRPLVIGGAVPSPRSIAEGSYPYFKKLTLVVRKDPSPLVRSFVDHVFSPASLDLFGQLGYWATGKRDL